MTVVDGGPLSAGASQVSLAVEAPGDFLVHASLSVDGQKVGEARDLPLLTSMAPFEGIDVGIDRRSPVSWWVYERHGCFPWTGTLHSVTYTPGELAPDAGPRWLDVLRDAGTRYD